MAILVNSFAAIVFCVPYEIKIVLLSMTPYVNGKNEYDSHRYIILFYGSVAKNPKIEAKF